MQEKSTIIRHERDGWHAESNRTGDIIQMRRTGWSVVCEDKNGVKFFAPDSETIFTSILKKRKERLQ